MKMKMRCERDRGDDVFLNLNFAKLRDKTIPQNNSANDVVLSFVLSFVLILAQNFETFPLCAYPLLKLSRMQHFFLL